MSPSGHLVWIAAAGVAFGAFIALDHLVLHTAVLTTFYDRAPLSPIYAFWMPEFRVSALLFIGVATAMIAVAPRLLDTRTRDVWFGAAVFCAGLAVPLALLLVRERFDYLGSQFLIYPHEEYFEDAARITDLGGFLARYPELAPQLSLHGRVHPPGFASLLFIISRIAGPSPFAAGAVIVLIFSGGILLAWRAAALVLGQRSARIAALLLLAVPSLIDFACTSMDAVFFSSACLVLLAAFAALADTGRWWHSAFTGLAFYASAILSFSALPLGLFVLTYGLVRWRERGDSHIPRQLALILVSFLAASVGFFALTGFDLWTSFLVARQQHYQIMAQVTGQLVSSAYWTTSLGNVTALLIGTGLAVVPLFFRSLLPGLKVDDIRPLAVATSVNLAVLGFGALYTMETERILMFAMPWLALSAAGGVQLSDSAVRLIVGVGWLQAFVMEVLLFTLW